MPCTVQICPGIIHDILNMMMKEIAQGKLK